MRPFLETLALLLGIGVILTLARGFPQLGGVLRILLLNPLGLLALGALLFWVYILRRRASGRRAGPRED